jgi:hypothetical protein
VRVVYDLEVDTSYTESLVCARTIAARVHTHAHVHHGEALPDRPVG